MLKLVDLLDEDDDVQDVYANVDIPDEVLENLWLSEVLNNPNIKPKVQVQSYICSFWESIRV